MKRFFKTSNYDKYYKGLIPYFKKGKNQEYFTIILSFAASIFFALFAINPTVTTIVKLNKEISDSKIVNNKLSQKINNLSSLSQHYQEISDDLPFIMNAIPNTPNAPEMLAQIQSVAKDSSITIKNIGIDPIQLTKPVVTNNRSSLSFTLSGQGTYQNMSNFLSILINIQRTISINSISITRESEGTGIINSTIKGTAYYKNQ